MSLHLYQESPIYKVDHDEHGHTSLRRDQEIGPMITKNEVILIASYLSFLVWSVKYRN